MATLQEVEVTLTSHMDVCAVRYDSINARLKRLEQILMASAGTIILLLFGIVVKLIGLQ
jgi:hypothetical protein